MKIVILFLILGTFFSCKDKSDDQEPQNEYLGITLEPSTRFQTIHNFGASDAWSCQFVGKNWPLEKREQIADLLFSRQLNTDGSPLGIGLSSWRFNIGAGSAEQGNSSGISDQWRRAEGFMSADMTYDWSKQAGQRWFLSAAKERGVNTFTGFVNSPPVALTKNGKAYSSGGSSVNLPILNFDDYAQFLGEVISYLKSDEGIELDYISPFNEPQWDWDNAGQEGSPWLNDEMSSFVQFLNQALDNKNLNSLIELPEAGQIQYLYETHNRPGRSNQVEDFFNPTSNNYIGNLSHVAPKVAGHSYYTTWNLSHFIQTRRNLDTKMQSFPNLEYWMSEYTILENNSEINGNGRDLGILPALYMARVIHTDLTVANASAWQWWLAVSPYNYKDGLVYIDWNKNDGQFYTSKMLWALGNYSRFIQPGMMRIGLRRSDNRSIEQTTGGVMVSSFVDTTSGKTVTVVLNYSQQTVPIKIDIDGKFVNCTIYRTSGSEDLKKIANTSFEEPVSIMPESITTFVEAQ